MRRGDHASAVGFVREVCGNKCGDSPGCGNFLSGCSELRFRSRGEEYSGALQGKKFGGGLPDAASRAGNQSNFILE